MTELERVNKVYRESNELKGIYILKDSFNAHWYGLLNLAQECLNNSEQELRYVDQEFPTYFEKFIALKIAEAENDHPRLILQQERKLKTELKKQNRSRRKN